jgi:ribosomal protein S18 acetylase RimI-like enzyme
MRRGHGSALLEYAVGEMFLRRVGSAALWVLTDNAAARTLYRKLGFTETEQRRRCEFPPFPEELEMVRTNPAAPRRRAS